MIDEGISQATTPAGVCVPASRERARPGETTAGLLNGLARDVTLLVRQEAALVRAEVSEKIEQARNGISAVATGSIVTHAGLLFLLLAAVLGLDQQLRRPWLSALIVGGVVTLIGLVLRGRGKRSLSATHLAPERG
jgi:putative superfamily III holin-X